MRKRKRQILLVIVGAIIFLYLCVMNISYKGRNVIFMMNAIKQLEATDEGIIKIDKETYMTGNNKVIASLFETNGYEATVFFVQCEYCKTGDKECRVVYGETYFSKYILWTIPEGILKESP